jgi:hypothetical protein
MSSRRSVTTTLHATPISSPILSRELGDAATQGFRIEDFLLVRLEEVFLGLGDGLLGAVGKRE